MINLPNNDSYIVNRDELLVELTRLMVLKQPITIALNNEGPCAASLGLYNILDQLVAKFDYNPSNIFIKTCNMLEQHDKYKIVYEPQVMYLNAAKQLHQQFAPPNKQFNEEFLHFGNFVGHGNMHRLHLSSHLYTQYRSKTLQSYHYNRRSNYYRLFAGLEDMMFDDYSDQEIDTAYNFLQHLPLTVDDIDTSPIMYPSTFNIIKVYHKFFVDVVNLTYFSGNSFYIDEKIWRPIVTRTPFIVQGPQNYIRNLQKLGFKTFGAWWDEGYSEDPSRTQVDGIIANIEKLSALSVDNLQHIYNDMS